MGREPARRFRAELVCFPLVAAVYAAHLFLSGDDTFYYDSSFYWQLGHSFERNGHFSLLASVGRVRARAARVRSDADQRLGSALISIRWMLLFA